MSLAVLKYGRETRCLYMGNEVVAIVKIRNYETGERNRERLCYLQSSPK